MVLLFLHAVQCSASMHVSQRSIGPSDRPLFSKKRSIRDQLFVVLLSLFIDELHHQFIIIQLIKKNAANLSSIHHYSAH
jgi:hypothetical protein